MQCSYPDFSFETPATIPTYEYVLKALELHVQTAHGSRPQNSNVAKVENPKRPVIHSNIIEGD